jgi:nicotinate-nucleotide pyrophosphorylase (carboxylating)
MPDLFDPIAAALAEDIGPGDLTSRYFIDETSRSRGRIFAKEDCVLAGADVAAEVFKRIDPNIDVRLVARDGKVLALGETALEMSGSTRSILTAERVALNFIQRLSGIATLTRRYVEAAARGGKARILDTRKTTPGLRRLEKAAVAAGGGTNHRMGLYDMVMVKDNHLLAKSGQEALQAAIHKLKQEHPGTRVELEADTLDQVRRFLTLEGVDVILLDNMPPSQLAEAVALAGGRVLLEASGGVNLDTVEAISATGVDYISVGALTHSARAVDFSLELF